MKVSAMSFRRQQSNPLRSNSEKTDLSVTNRAVLNDFVALAGCIREDGSVDAAQLAKLVRNLSDRIQHGQTNPFRSGHPEPPVAQERRYRLAFGIRQTLQNIVVKTAETNSDRPSAIVPISVDVPMVAACSLLVWGDVSPAPKGGPRVKGGSGRPKAYQMKRVFDSDEFCLFLAFLDALEQSSADRLRTCESCRGVFIGREGARTCGPRCRMALWRVEHPEQNQANDIKNELRKAMKSGFKKPSKKGTQ
jgi:hypothetical protein